MEVKFSLDQLNKLLAGLDELPHKYARGMIDYLQSIAKPQIEEQMKQATQVTQTEANSDTINNQ